MKSLGDFMKGFDRDNNRFNKKIKAGPLDELRTLFRKRPYFEIPKTLEEINWRKAEITRLSNGEEPTIPEYIRKMASGTKTPELIEIIKADIIKLEEQFLIEKDRRSHSLD